MVYKRLFHMAVLGYISPRCNWLKRVGEGGFRRGVEIKHPF